MELVSPAGSLEKLRYAWLYGADSAYLGVKRFSLRSRADNFHEEEFREIARIKGHRKLYCALNIFFHEADLTALEAEADYIAQYPFDAFIVSDLGVVSFLKKRFPGIALHLSTQASCTNRESARMYRDLGFSRVVLARELPLSEIRRVRDAVPDLQLEVFVHGAMCMAYSGRCLLSAALAGRSGNRGECAQTCRWTYRVLEEAKRPGVYLPIEEDGGYTAILSSKDLCMIDHLAELRDAGVDALKIEGRMKSVYYAAVTARAYRKALDLLDGKPVPDYAAFRDELLKVSHRDYSTGFFFDKTDMNTPALKSYERSYLFLATVEEKEPNGRYRLKVRNTIRATEELEYLGPDTACLRDTSFRLYDAAGLPATQLNHFTHGSLETSHPLEPGWIIRGASDYNEPAFSGFKDE